ncbi:MAG: PhoH family protein [Thermoprotei archaeon]|nr:MAG: PhoH family protein [Thermoprotei archaeon]
MGLLDKIEPKTEGQRKLVTALKNPNIEIVGVFGPTGTGKSLLSTAYGIDSVMDGTYDRFIIFRPVIDVTKGVELTPIELGDLYYRVAAEYLNDLLHGYISGSELGKLLESKRILIADPHFLRGRTFDNTVILFDDVQNASPENVCETIMRVGYNSKLIIAGDPIFQSVSNQEVNVGSLIREILLGEDKTVVVDLGLKDIVRPGAKRGLRLALELRMRKRSLSDIESKILNSARVHSPDADVITVVEFKDKKEELNITSENAPDALIISKEGYLGRLVGRGGERIQAIEKDLGMKIRCVELTSSLKDIVTAVHPVGWIGKHIVDVDFAGPSLQVSVISDALGAFIGQKGMYIRLLDHVFNKLMGIGVIVSTVEAKRKARRRKR